MICRSGRHRSVANVELWSNTLARRSRRQHSASLLYLSELDFWKNTCAGKCSECSKQSTRIFRTHYDRVRAGCPRLASSSDSVTEHWKRPRLENCSKSSAGKTIMKARFAENSLDEGDHFLHAPKSERQVQRLRLLSRNLNRGILDELTERLGNFHESARALADCLQTRNVTRKTDQSMIEAAKCMFHKLLAEASDDLERVTPQSRKSLLVKTIRNAPRRSPFEAASEKPCPRSETLVERSCSCRETPSQLHHETGARVEDTTFTRITGTGCRRFSQSTWAIYEFKMSSFTATRLNLLFAEAEQKGKTRHCRTYIGLGSDGLSADQLFFDLKFNP